MSSRPTPSRLPDGFLHRGEQVTRLEAFVDAAFAFAVTLLVISLEAIPASIPELILALKGVPAFALSFILIGMFWYAHVRWSRRYGLDDLPSVLLSLLLVFLVLVYVYPLKVLFSTFWSFVTNGWIPWTVEITTYADILQMFIVYGVAYSTLSLCMWALYWRAGRLHETLQLSLEERVKTAGEQAVWALGVLSSCASIVVAVLMPRDPPLWAGGAPGMVYFLMCFAGLVSGAVESRARRRIGDASVDPAQSIADSPMSVVKRWVDCFNVGDIDGLCSLYAADAVNHQVVAEPLNGRAAIRQMFEIEFGRANMTCVIESLHEDGNCAMLEWSDPNGLRGCGFFRVENGLIVFQRGYFDQLSFFRKQGLAVPNSYLDR